MLRTSLRSYALAAGVSALLVLPACGGGGGGGDDDDGIASLSSTTAAADDGDDSGDDDQPTEAEFQQAALDFAQCMRDHGIDMPDPEFTDGGGVVQRAEAGANGPDQEAMDAAQEACQPIMEDVTSGFEPDPEREAEMRQQALDFAQCMRDNGVENYPDPVFEDGGMTQRLDDSMNPESAEFQQATEICQEEVGGPMGDGEVIDGAPAGGGTGEQEDSP